MKTQRNTRAMAKKQQPKDSKKRPAKVTNHLTSDMVVAAIAALKDGNGSSTQSIKNYIKTIYGDVSGSPSIGLALKSAAREGKIVLVAGKGSLCHFKLAEKGKSKTLRAKGAVKKSRKATTKPKVSSEMLVTKKQVKDIKKPTKKPAKGVKKVSKGPTTLKTSSSSAKKTPKGASKKQGARKPLKKVTKKRDLEETDTDTRKK